MKLQIVPAGQGVQWVKQGMRTFWRQPLALSGLFFMFMAAMSLLSMVPLLGNILALVILPGATLGLMAATKEALTGKFPMPVLLVSAFRAGKQQLQAMLLLGAIYAAGFLLVLGISALADGGKFAQLYLVGGAMSVELLQAPDFQLAVLLSMALYLPLSLLFWHAPALVHWHGVQPVKSLFFSLVACLRNFWAFTLFGLAWMGVFVGMGTAVSLVASLLGSVEVVSVMMFPLAMLMAAMFFTSLYFTVHDCFEETASDSV
ncbi:MAG TPA: BPSS1780 family membrane protein [Rhodoferax sp.]|nr:BPSS1780 family membrane protein [Rhodoferax sp.]